MKTSIKKISILILSVLLSMQVNAKPAPAKAAEEKPPLPETTLPDPNEQVIKKIAAKFMEENNVPGVAIETYVNGKPYEYYFGYANPETKDPVQRKTIFEIGSISKVMTGLLFAQEVDYAKIGLNDPVTKYVKELPPSFDKVKLQDLATHTAGLPLFLPSNITDKATMQNYFLHWTPLAEPEDEWIYSTVGIGLLGMALENSTEMDFDKLYHRHILNPIGMVIGVNIPPSLQKYAAQGHDKEGRPVSMMDAAKELFPAGGAIKASASDMQKFLGAAIGIPGTSVRVFYPMRLTQSAFVRLHDRQQGLGWTIYPLKDNYVADLLNVPENMEIGPTSVKEVYERPPYTGDALIDKTGQTKGFRAYIALIPDKKSGVVILTNKVVSNKAIVYTGREILFHITKMTRATA